MYENPYQKKQKREKIKNMEPINDENDSQLFNSWPLDAIPPEYQLSPKEEKLHQKTLRTFFFLHAIVSLKFKNHVFRANFAKLEKSIVTPRRRMA
jgi:hypothetical protein